jgi:hypothetical protein
VPQRLQWQLLQIPYPNLTNPPLFFLLRLALLVCFRKLSIILTIQFANLKINYLTIVIKPLPMASHIDFLLISTMDMGEIRNIVFPTIYYLFTLLSGLQLLSKRSLIHFWHQLSFNARVITLFLIFPFWIFCQSFLQFFFRHWVSLEKFLPVWKSNLYSHQLVYLIREICHRLIWTLFSKMMPPSTTFYPNFVPPTSFFGFLFFLPQYFLPSIFFYFHWLTNIAYHLSFGHTNVIFLTSLSLVLPQSPFRSSKHFAPPPIFRTHFPCLALMLTITLVHFASLWLHMR